MQDFEKEYRLFQEALDIQDPWYIEDYKLVKSSDQFHVFLDFKRGAKFPCPHCGNEHNGVHDIANDDRMWRHKDFWQYQTYLHARLPRIKCDICDKVLTVQVDWSRPKAGFTWLFEAQVMQLMKEMPVAAVAREVNEHDTRLWRVFHYYVQKNMDELDLSNITRIAVDETSSRRGHRYVTLFVDVDSKRVIFAIEGKDASVIQSFKQHLENKGIEATSILECCCDMSPAFIKGIEEAFPKAHITFDKFHVMKLVNEAVDKVRRQEQNDEPLLKKTRYLWLKNSQNLSQSQHEKLMKLGSTSNVGVE